MRIGKGDKRCIYNDALMVQSAPNLRGIIKSLGDVREAVLDEMSRGEWQGSFESHPAIVLFSTQIAFLTHSSNLSIWQAAHKYCQDKVFDSMPPIKARLSDEAKELLGAELVDKMGRV